MYISNDAMRFIGLREKILKSLQREMGDNGQRILYAGKLSRGLGG